MQLFVLSAYVYSFVAVNSLFLVNMNQVSAVYNDCNCINILNLPGYGIQRSACPVLLATVSN